MIDDHFPYNQLFLNGIGALVNLSYPNLYTGSFPGFQPHRKFSKALRIASGSVFAWSIMVLPDLSFREYRDMIYK